MTHQHHQAPVGPAEIHAAALQAHQHGVTIIPVRADGSKAPALRAWQQHRTTERDLHHWFATGRFAAMGAVTGPASGNLEMMEIEGPYTDALDGLWEHARQAGISDLWERINNGWVELSPSGGIHWFYRVAGDPVPGNTKLAQDAPTLDPATGKRTTPTIAETRGAGGQTVIAPTPGAAHPTGNPWVALTGGPATIPTITAEEREALHGVLATLDKRTSPNPYGATSASRAGTSTERRQEWATGALAELEKSYYPDTAGGGATPPDQYEEETSWADILEPAGWTVSHQQGQTTYWTRPGKKHGISATTGRADDRDRLFVFSSSTEFPTFEPITKFGAYTLLEHGGDFEAAARQLRRDGYGRPDMVTPLPPRKQQGTSPSADGGAQQQQDGVPDNVVQLPPPTDTPAPAGPPALAALTPTEALTDDANGIEYVREHHHHIRFDTQQGRWLVWDGTRWERQPASGGTARELAKITARKLPETGAAGADKHKRHRTYSLSASGISNMLAMAATDPAITITPAELDCHPLELNTPAGIIDLATGELRPSDPARMHTKTTAVAPDPAADPTVWQEFLTQTFPDPAVREYTQRLIGHSLLGEIRAHVLPFAHGSGGNGKGVFLETIRYVLGEYAGVAPAGFLMESKFAEHATELADLQGRRFVICSEVNQHDRFDEAKVKQLTGGDTVKARFMRQDYFEFEPTHSLWLMGNDKPAVASGGNAFWRRLRLIPFTQEVPEEKRVDGLQGILSKQHGPAVLWWAIQGAAAYLRDGLGTEPAEVRAATQDYAESVDTVSRFIQDRCVLHPSATALVPQLRAAYEKWCDENGERPLKARSLTAHLTRHGVKAGAEGPRIGGQRAYGGIGLKAEDHPDWTEQAHQNKDQLAGF